MDSKMRMIPKNNKNNLSSLVMLLSSIAFGLCLLPSPVNGAQNTRWVHGSWVNLRSEPSTESEVNAMLTANMEVSVISEINEWCEISAESLGVRGFTLCRMLGEKPLSLKEVIDPGSDSYSPLRAFWMAPSVYRLKLAGKFYENTMLTERQKERQRTLQMRFEDDTKAWENRSEPKRPVIREFEAMKALLSKGVVANEEVMDSRRWNYQQNAAMVKQLTPAKPSLFKNARELIAHPTNIEVLSAQFGIKEHLRVLNRSRWHRFANSVELVGTWDMGDLEVTLNKPVIEYVIGRTGLASALQWRGPEIQYATSEYSCVDDRALRGEKPLPDYPSVKDPLVWFYMKSPLPYKTVTVNVSQFKVDEKGSVNEAGSKEYYRYEVDIDGDRIVDLAVLDLQIKWSSTDESHLAEREVFANIAGEWTAIQHSEYYDECT